MINTLIKYEQDLPGGVRVIRTVTLNPAADVTYLVDRLVLRSAARVASVRQRAGGTDVNVARVGATCGADVCATSSPASAERCRYRRRDPGMAGEADTCLAGSLSEKIRVRGLGGRQR